MGATKLEQAYGIKAETFAADLEKEDDLACLETVLAGNPAIRILVNNAGIARLSPVAEAPTKDSLSQITLNITALDTLGKDASSLSRLRGKFGQGKNSCRLNSIRAKPQRTSTA